MRGLVMVGTAATRGARQPGYIPLHKRASESCRTQILRTSFRFMARAASPVVLPDGHDSTGSCMGDSQLLRGLTDEALAEMVAHRHLLYRISGAWTVSDIAREVDFSRTPC